MPEFHIRFLSEIGTSTDLYLYPIVSQPGVMACMRLATHPRIAGGR